MKIQPDPPILVSLHHAPSVKQVMGEASFFKDLEIPCLPNGPADPREQRSCAYSNRWYADLGLGDFESGGKGLGKGWDDVGGEGAQAPYFSCEAHWKKRCSVVSSLPQWRQHAVSMSPQLRRFSPIGFASCPSVHWNNRVPTVFASDIRGSRPSGMGHVDG
ncbi:unnamed protein product [Microthlaspi erraticum]|uniref:Uncharacterized protein n=1 Tax=Microthlaspi erraticum TaxID=1685480 RepID=A0A6D2IKC3_9BRAS|nr:unnamed protein product [Microthlaspi erraticum]